MEIKNQNVLAVMVFFFTIHPFWNGNRWSLLFFFQLKMNFDYFFSKFRVDCLHFIQLNFFSCFLLFIVWKLLTENQVWNSQRKILHGQNSKFHLQVFMHCFFSTVYAILFLLQRKQSRCLLCVLFWFSATKTKL